MIFGENNFLYKDNMLDIIETKDYIHTSLCMREGLVFLMRNVPIFGNYFIDRKIDQKNLLVRIRRQIFHANLMLNKKIDLHKHPTDILLKAIGRISEALLYLAVSFPQLNIITNEILKKEDLLSKTLNLDGTLSWLKYADDLIINI